MERKRSQHRRRGGSLQEGSSRRQLHESRSKKRLERHSSVGYPHSIEVILLERLQVKFLKAYMPAGRLSRPRYVMKVTNADLNLSWEMVRPFRDFYDFKEELVKVLDHGHLCNSNCPWLYMYATHHFPRRHLFRSRQPSVVASRLQELEAFINTVLEMFREKRRMECQVTAKLLPQKLYEFLFQGMIFDRSDFANTQLEERVSLNGTLSDAGGVDEEKCVICSKPLSCLSEESVSPQSLTKTALSTTTLSSSRLSTDTAKTRASLTTLDCGHVFHDECILLKLNEHLRCPMCTDTVGPRPQSRPASVNPAA